VFLNGHPFLCLYNLKKFVNPFFVTFNMCFVMSAFMKVYCEFLRILLTRCCFLIAMIQTYAY